MPVEGFATAADTDAYARRHRDTCAPHHFRTYRGVKLGSIGIGTYLGDADDATDRSYSKAIRTAVGRGCNVIDTAANYRCQRSERAVGKAIAEIVREGTVSRNELLVCTKGGFIPYDGTPPATGAEALTYFKESYLDRGVCRASDIVAGCHCIAPGFLRHGIATSLANMGLESIDAFYVHNPETQLGEVSRDSLRQRLHDAFEALEAEADAGRIRMYGVATWEAFRAKPEARDAMEIEDLMSIARGIAGNATRFRAVQVPYNIGMPEAFTESTQRLAGRRVPFLAAAQELGLLVMTSVPLLQKRLTTGLPAVVSDAFPGLDTDAQRAIQFVRSTPGVHVGVVGMKTDAHIRENLAVAGHPPSSREQFMSLFEAK